MVFFLANSLTYGSISGLDRVARTSAHSMPLHNDAREIPSSDRYGTSFDQFHLPKFSLFAHEAHPNSFLIPYISLGLTVRGMFVSVISGKSDMNYIVTAATSAHVWMGERCYCQGANITIPIACPSSSSALASQAPTVAYGIDKYNQHFCGVHPHEVR